MVEGVSRWVELIALNDLSAEELIKAILSLLGRFGAMNKIIWKTDLGSGFIAEITEKLK